MNVDLNAAGTLLLTVILATHAFVIEAFDFFGFGNSQYRPIVLDLQDVTSVETARLNTGEAACRCGGVSDSRHATVVINTYFHLSSFEF